MLFVLLVAAEATLAHPAGALLVGELQVECDNTPLEDVFPATLLAIGPLLLVASFYYLRAGEAGAISQPSSDLFSIQDCGLQCAVHSSTAGSQVFTCL